MRRSHRGAKRLSSTSSDDEPLAKKAAKGPKPRPKSPDPDGSSSDSDIENYLQPMNKIDLSSSFFDVKRGSTESAFDQIEKGIFAGVSRLTDSDTDDDQPLKAEIIKTEAVAKLNFQKLHDFTKKMDEAKQHVERYNAKKREEHQQTDIVNMLVAAEPKLSLDNEEALGDLHSSDFESCSDSEKEGWEEVEETQKSVVPKEGLQITVEMPNAIKKKKGVDLLAAMKRRLNRIRKENQLLIHKVHLLCWIAHGNYVSSTINNEKILAMALSLLPSDNCYPSDRADLKYLEQVLRWYRKTVTDVQKPVPPDLSFEDLLQSQIAKKEVYNKNNLVFVFVAILRSLGIQCRVVFSFQVEPLRPPSSELCSLSTKTDAPKGKTKNNDPSTSKSREAAKGKIASPTAKRGEATKDKVVSLTAKRGEATKAKVASPTAKRGETEKGKVVVPTTRSREATKGKVALSTPKSRGVTKGSASQNRAGPLTSGGDAKKPSANGVCSPKSSKSRTSLVDERVFAQSKKTVARSAPQVNGKTKEESSSRVSSKVLRDRGKTAVQQGSKKELKGEAKVKEEEKSKSTRKVEAKVSSSGNSGIPPKSDQKKEATKTPKKPTESARRSKSTSGESSTSAATSTRTRSKSSGDGFKSTKKEIIKIKLPTKKAGETARTLRPKSIPQLDGVNDSDSEDLNSHPLLGFDLKGEAVLQLDGSNEDDNSKAKLKPNLRKLKQIKKSNPCPSKTHPPKPPTTTKYKDTDSEDDFRPGSPFSKKNTNSRANLRKLTSRRGVTFSSPLVADNSKYFGSKSQDVRGDVVQLVKSRIKQQKEKDRSKTVKRKTRNDSESDSDYAPEPLAKKHHDSGDEFVPKTKVKRRVQPKSLLGDQEAKKRKGVDVWAEVFLENEEKWISVDVIHGQVHCVQELYARANHPVSYVIAWNNDNSLKDITRRYCQNFNTVTRKLRVDAKWWQESVRPFLGQKTARDREEDDELERQQLEKPLPTSIAEYKNHPLYVLKRHLLKFEGLYPPDAPTLGFVRKEAVYSRQCVYTLHSREIWLKHAKTVKLGEKPYKIVKARPKYDKLSNTMITDQLLEIFGPWQTEDYVPPTAENGVVPRNAFGNVELFKPCMLPKKTVHLQLPGLNKVARRMNIDCASAIVGFDFHSGWSHPTYDGFVVCEEFADILVAAWELDREETEKKEQEKVEKRVYGNWRKLIKGLLIRERLKAKYDFGEPSTQAQSNRKQNDSDSESE